MSVAVPDRADHIIRALRRADASIAGEDVHALADELTHALPAHLDSEERAGGLFAALEEAGAFLTLATLRADHDALRATLRRLDDAVERRDGTAQALLASLTLRLRAHERVEAAAARKLGLTLAEPPERTPCPEVEAATASALERIAREVLARCAEAPDALVTAVRITLPSWVPRAACVDLLEQELAARGLDFVDVEVVAAEREPALAVVFTEPGWTGKP